MLYYLKVIKKILEAKFLKKRSPLFVSWLLTNRCNSKCKYCRHWEFKGEEIKTEEVLKIIPVLAEMGTCKINFTGGEPLLREDFAEIIKRTNKEQIRIIVSSNGILVPDKVNILKNIDFLSLSLDGPEEIHNSLRGKDSYKAVLRAAEVARNKGIKVVFSTVITDVNINYLTHVLNVAHRFNSRVFFSLIEFNYYADSENVKNLIPDIRSYRFSIENLIKEKWKGNNNIANSLSALYYFRNWPISKISLRCKMADLILCYIQPDGNIYSCAEFVNKEKPRNCIQEGFKNAFLNMTRKSLCKPCWCGDRIELKSIFSFNIDSIFNMAGFIHE